MPSLFAVGQPSLAAGELLEDARFAVSFQLKDAVGKTRNKAFALSFSPRPAILWPEAAKKASPRVYPGLG
jgi:hypothetical protein